MGLVEALHPLLHSYNIARFQIMSSSLFQIILENVRLFEGAGSKTQDEPK